MHLNLLTTMCVGERGHSKQKKSCYLSLRPVLTCVSTPVTRCSGIFNPSASKGKVDCMSKVMFSLRERRETMTFEAWAE